MIRRWAPLGLESGPSPRSWGRFRQVYLLRGRHRSIPTLVGTIPSSRNTVELPAVHPHARGDDWPRTTQRSPRAVHPHARGDDWRWFGRGCGGLRSIPTLVGTITSGSPGSRNNVGPSPRWWGRFEKVRHQESSQAVHPHVSWGYDDQVLIACGILGGSIPTLVGTITSPALNNRGTAVHPHERGDDAHRANFIPITPAVHPHGRGDDHIIGAP